jgi:hypothetical protein
MNEGRVIRGLFNYFRGGSIILNSDCYNKKDFSINEGYENHSLVNKTIYIGVNKKDLGDFIKFILVYNPN